MKNTKRSREQKKLVENKYENIRNQYSNKNLINQNNKEKMLEEDEIKQLEEWTKKNMEKYF